MATGAADEASPPNASLASRVCLVFSLSLPQPKDSDRIQPHLVPLRCSSRAVLSITHRAQLVSRMPHGLPQSLAHCVRPACSSPNVAEALIMCSTLVRMEWAAPASSCQVPSEFSEESACTQCLLSGVDQAPPTHCTKRDLAEAIVREPAMQSASSAEA